MRTTAGWEWLENFEQRPLGNLGGQGGWINGEGQGTVADTGGNLAAKVTGGAPEVVLPSPAVSTADGPFWRREVSGG